MIKITSHLRREAYNIGTARKNNRLFIGRQYFFCFHWVQLVRHHVVHKIAILSLIITNLRRYFLSLFISNQTFASPLVAEQVSGCAVGTIVPFPMTRELELVVDPSLLKNDEIYFNAGRLDRSMALRTSDYLAVAAPRVERIATEGIESG